MVKKQKKNSKKIASKSTKGLLAYHIAASLVSIAPHPHTGRSVAHHHTSHGVLLVALLLTGILLFSNLGALRVAGLTNSASKTITVNITGDPPTVGADITFPFNNSSTRSSQIAVSGTCEASTLVATYRNGVFAGSSMCTSSGNYSTPIQLNLGTNTLQSQNYDLMNQPGPVTAQVSIIRLEDPIVATTTPPQAPTPPVVKEIATTKTDIDPTPTPIVITEPATQPAENPCYDTSKNTETASANPTIIANCINRSIYAGQKIILPIRVTGDHAPFSLSINWGDGITELKTVADTDYHDYEHIYQKAGIIDVALKTTDAKGETSFLQTVVQVNNDAPASPIGASGSTFATITAGLRSIWTEAPVPLYWAAVTLVLGFWVGDIFQRFNAKGKYSTKRTAHKTHHRQRHA